MLVCSLMADYAICCSKLIVLQTQQVISENDDSDDGPLTLVLCSLCFFSHSQTLFASKSSAPFLMRQCHLARSCEICSQDSGGKLKYL